MSQLSPTLGGEDRSLSVKVYEYLREAIIEGELQPGTRLLERELSARLEVSRIPVREALPQLEAEGLIETVPRRGSIVTQLTLRDISELFDVRTSLDVLAARTAAQQAGRHPQGNASNRMTTAFERARLATESGSATEIAAANADFHVAILDAAGNRLLQALMAPINARVRWLFRLTSERDPHLLCQEHGELHEAIVNGDADLASSLAFSHVERGRRPSLSSLAGILPADRGPA
jgi:DNA-binding GntR family transcriptional regulator